MNEEKDQNIVDNNQPIPPPPGIRKLLHKGKNAGKNAIKNISNTLNMGFKNLWIPLSAKGKFIVIVLIIFIILCACAVVVLADYSVNVSDNTITGYVSSLSESSGSGQFYNRTGSLLLMKDEDIKKISEMYLDETEIANYNLHTLMKKEYGKDAEDNNKKVSVNEKKSLYEHFLNAEKYNFNNINWVKYTRSTQDGNPDMQVDKETRLEYPKDDKGTTITSFANQAQPYLQNYIIPYSLYAGLITDGRIKGEDAEGSGTKELKFGHEILKSTYHDIQINQYNIKSHTIVTKDIVYDLMKLTVTHTVTYNKDGEETSNTYSTPIISTKSSCVHQTSEPEVIDQYDTWNIKYCVKYAKMFDKHVINEYQYTEYNLENEPDDQTLTRDIYKDDNYIQYETSNYNIPDDEYTYTYDKDGNLRKKTATYTMDMKKGYTEIITSTWKDILEQLSHEEKSYTNQDVDEVVDNKLSSSEEAYYKKYEYNTETNNYLEVLNLFDIANAQKDVYKNYLRDKEQYSENIGYPRSWLSFSFYTLKQSLKEISEADSGWKYFYGFSMGATEATGASANGTSSTSAILSNVDYSNLPNGKLGWPSPGHTTIRSAFKDPSRGGKHYGIDISMPIGSTFVAAASGEVISANSSCTDNYGKSDALNSNKTYCGGNMGNYVQIKVDGSEMYLIYMHMTDVTVKKGDKVTAGQAIGTSGTTGRSTGPHAHFEVRVGGVSSSKYSVDPMPLLQKDYNSN